MYQIIVSNGKLQRHHYPLKFVVWAEHSSSNDDHNDDDGVDVSRQNLYVCVHENACILGFLYTQKFHCMARVQNCMYHTCMFKLLFGMETIINIASNIQRNNKMGLLLLLRATRFAISKSCNVHNKIYIFFKLLYICVEYALHWIDEIPQTVFEIQMGMSFECLKKMGWVVYWH